MLTRRVKSIAEMPHEHVRNRVYKPVVANMAVSYVRQVERRQKVYLK
jgi:hypothetical protein